MPQVIASQGTPFTGTGWALALSAQGELQVIGAAGVVAGLGPLQRWQWYLVALSLPDGAPGDGPAVAGTAWRRPVRPWPDDPPVEAAFAASTLLPPPAAPLLLAAARDAASSTVCHLDGRIDRPRLLAGTVTGAQLQAWAAAPDDAATLAATADLVGAWDFSRDVASDRACDVSGSGRHGRLVNLPARAVTGHNFRARPPASGWRPSSTVRSTSIATIWRTRAGRSTSRCASRGSCGAASMRPGCGRKMAHMKNTCRSWCVRRRAATAPGSRC